MLVRRFLALCQMGLLLVVSTTACGGTASSSRFSCSNGDCSVTVSGARGSGDLYDTDAVEYEYRVHLEEDQDARVTVIQELGDDEVGTREKATLSPGESAQLFDYTVEYLDFTDGAATFDFSFQG